MRSHARDKGHEMKGDDKRWGMGGGDEYEGKRDRDGEREFCEDKRRPSKRRKIMGLSESMDDLEDQDLRLGLN